MPHYKVTLGEIPPEKISEFHELCTEFGFEVQSVQFCAGTETKKHDVTAVHKTTSNNAVCILDNRQKPRADCNLRKAYDAVKNAFGSNKFTYAEAGKVIRKVLTPEQMSVSRRHLVTGRYIKIIKDA